MSNLLKIFQIVIALILIVLVLIQSQGSGLSGVIGTDQSFRTKRGVEKFVLYATIITTVLFLVLALLGTVL